MFGLLNLGSLLLGLIAWICPVINLIKYKKHNNRNWVNLSFISMSACAISICFQIFYNYHLVKISDWTALIDTTGALIFVVSVFLIVSIILNSINLLLYRNRIAK